MQSLTPDGILVVEASDWMWTRSLDAREEASIVNAVERRQREFRAGRNCAHEALARLGIADNPVLRNEDRTPRWPKDVVGSITHTDGYCAAAVAWQRDFQSVGIDAEKADALPDGIIEMICTRAEIDHFSSLPTASVTPWAKILFSAKESTYKCYYPLTRAFLDFHDVEVTLQPELGRFTARLRRAEAPPARGSRVFEGRFFFDEHYVFTVVAQRAPRAAASRDPRHRERK